MGEHRAVGFRCLGMMGCAFALLGAGCGDEYNVYHDAGPDAARDAGARDAGRDAEQTDAGPCGGSCTAPTAMCRESDGTCVECLSDGDCMSPTAARCDVGMGTCVACEDSAECAGHPGAEVCALSGALSGRCVECTAADRTACGSNVCDSRMGTCTSTALGTTGLCQPCVSDAQCSEGKLCVEMTYGSPAESVGWYCLWRQDAAAPGPAGDCFTARPYVAARAGAESIDGTAAAVCGLAVTTCDALNHFRTPGRGTGSCALSGDPDDCGVDGQDDGPCVMAGMATNRCSVWCGSDDDCLSGFTCNTMVSRRYCNL